MKNTFAYTFLSNTISKSYLWINTIKKNLARVCWHPHLIPALRMQKEGIL